MHLLKKQIIIPKLLKKVKYYNTKISETESKVNNQDHDKYITTSEFNKLTTENFKARLAQANLVTKADFDAKLTSLKHLIQVILKAKTVLKKMVARII